MRKKNDHLIPDRGWVASITTEKGEKFTTTIYGSNAYKAERIYEATHPGSVAIAREEARTR